MGPLGPWDASVRPEPYRAFFGGGDGGSAQVRDHPAGHGGMGSQDTINKRWLLEDYGE